jgi:hypothetical protein
MKGMNMKKVIFIFAFVLMAPSAFCANNISPQDAKHYIGQQKTVCGTVVSTRYAAKIKGQPTFLYLNKPYPDHIFTVLIGGFDRSKFHKSPEKFYKNKKICVFGRIEQNKGIPEIIARVPSQITEK